jgi:5-methylcytosine-specific restriction endonuclease McrA
LDQAQHKCSKCGWCEVNPSTGKCPLESHHIDGDASNCDLQNLKILCPNCHSLTSTYKALNKGNGFQERLRYSKL